MSASLLNAECTQRASEEFSLRRLAGFAFGIGTQALFAVTVVGLFSFLRYGATRSSGSWIFIDCLLALQFAIPHSLLLHPRTRSALKHWVPTEFYGAFFCVCTCVSLWLIFAFWQRTTTILWDLDGLAANAVVGCFLFASE